MRARVFAVEDTSAQVCWDGGRRGELTFSAGPTRRTVEADGGPGAVLLQELPADTTLDLVVEGSGLPARRVGRFRTLRPPPGRLLARFATINDIHVGAHSFGTLRPQWDDGAGEPHPQRCARAAADEARSWGAELLVVKGDLTQQGTPEEWREVAELIGGIGMPSLVIEGNHDVRTEAVDGTTFLAEHGIALHQRPAAVDLPGVRVAVFPTAAWHVDEGTVDERHRRALVELVGTAPGPAVVAMHHYPQRFRWPTMYPSGIPGPSAARFLDELAEANPAVMVLTGHSHRHRRHRHGPLAVAEVGSTKDYPGSWAGYAVHEGGIRQVTMRVAAPDVLRWTETGRRVLGGVWSVWGPGARHHRCFSHVWPSGGRPAPDERPAR